MGGPWGYGGWGMGKNYFGISQLSIVELKPIVIKQKPKIACWPGYPGKFMFLKLT